VTAAVILKTEKQSDSEMCHRKNLLLRKRESQMAAGVPRPKLAEVNDVFVVRIDAVPSARASTAVRVFKFAAAAAAAAAAAVRRVAITMVVAAADSRAALRVRVWNLNASRGITAAVLDRGGGRLGGEELCGVGDARRQRRLRGPAAAYQEPAPSQPPKSWNASPWPAAARSSLHLSAGARAPPRRPRALRRPDGAVCQASGAGEAAPAGIAAPDWARRDGRAGAHASERAPTVNQRAAAAAPAAHTATAGRRRAVQRRLQDPARAGPELFAAGCRPQRRLGAGAVASHHPMWRPGGSRPARRRGLTRDCRDARAPPPRTCRTGA
jgi:hypothetical protein